MALICASCCRPRAENYAPPFAIVVAGGLGFGEADAGAGALLALPLVVVAQARLMFLYLRFQFREGLLAGGANVRSGSRGVHRAGGQGQVQREGMLFFVRILRKNSVQLNQVGLITFQQLHQFFRRACSLSFDGFVRVDMLVADRKFHECTCRSVCGRGGPRRFLLCTAW